MCDRRTEPLPRLTPPRFPKQMGAGHAQQAEQSVSQHPTLLKWIVWIPHAKPVLVISMRGGRRPVGLYLCVLRPVASKPNLDPSRVVVRDFQGDRIDAALLRSTKVGPSFEVRKLARGISLEAQSTRSFAIPRSTPPLSDRSRTPHCRTLCRSSTWRPHRTPLTVQRPSARPRCLSGARSPWLTWTPSLGAG
jgi:hypothetical protein